MCVIGCIEICIYIERDRDDEMMIHNNEMPLYNQHEDTKVKTIDQLVVSSVYFTLLPYIYIFIYLQYK